jgi:hypothetical protein
MKYPRIRNGTRKSTSAAQNNAVGLFDAFLRFFDAVPAGRERCAVFVVLPLLVAIVFNILYRESYFYYI